MKIKIRKSFTVTIFALLFSVVRAGFLHGGFGSDSFESLFNYGSSAPVYSVFSRHLSSPQYTVRQTSSGGSPPSGDSYGPPPSQSGPGSPPNQSSQYGPPQQFGDSQSQQYGPPPSSSMRNGPPTPGRASRPRSPPGSSQYGPPPPFVQNSNSPSNQYGPSSGSINGPPMSDYGVSFSSPSTSGSGWGWGDTEEYSSPAPVQYVLLQSSDLLRLLPTVPEYGKPSVSGKKGKSKGKPKGKSGTKSSTPKTSTPKPSEDEGTVTEEPQEPSTQGRTDDFESSRLTGSGGYSYSPESMYSKPNQKESNEQSQSISYEKYSNEESNNQKLPKKLIPVQKDVESKNRIGSTLKSQSGFVDDVDSLPSKESVEEALRVLSRLVSQINLSSSSRSALLQRSELLQPLMNMMQNSQKSAYGPAQVKEREEVSDRYVKTIPLKTQSYVVPTESESEGNSGQNYYEVRNNNNNNNGNPTNEHERRPRSKSATFDIVSSISTAY